MTPQEERAAIEYRREYQRRYRREHPERVRETQLRYWLRKAQKQAEGSGTDE